MVDESTESGPLSSMDNSKMDSEISSVKCVDSTSNSLHRRPTPVGNSCGADSVMSDATHNRVKKSFIRVQSEKTPLPKLKDVERILLPDNEYTSVNAEQLQRIRKIHLQFSEGSKFSFNYNTLLLVASFLAGFGLANNSSTTIIASMLVSPIMGPVVGMAYGANIADWRLCLRALQTELISLVVCILTGAVVALSVGWSSIANSWPNAEMLNRGELVNFYIGLPIAFVSGLGVAVSLLDDQTSSLVGVAISASLLPPAVNAGMLWVAHIYKEFDILGEEECNDIHGCGMPPLSNLPIVEGVPSPSPSEYPSASPTDTTVFGKSDYWKYGLISLGLTVANILLIIISSILMFRMKERLPIKKKVFWDDLGLLLWILNQISSRLVTSIR